MPFQERHDVQSDDEMPCQARYDEPIKRHLKPNEESFNWRSEYLYDLVIFQLSSIEFSHLFYVFF